MSSPPFLPFLFLPLLYPSPGGKGVILLTYWILDVVWKVKTFTLVFSVQLRVFTVDLCVTIS
jgi:hypothetical protein